jgi:tetratricopeptide (TPR) repeat protein
VRDQPSTGNSTLPERRAVDATTIANRRRTDSRRLQQTVRGELDWIVMKCLEKDRNRRYESAGSLARDVERYLNDEPVQACPPSAGYRFRKFARRNKTLLATGGAIAAALVIGLGLAASQYLRATTESARAQTVSDLLREMLGSSDAARAKGVDHIVRELLDEFSAGPGSQPADQPDVAADDDSTAGQAADYEIARGYARLAYLLVTTHRQEEASDALRKANEHFAHAVTRGLAPAAHVLALNYLATTRLRLGDDAGYREACAVMLHVPADNDNIRYQQLSILSLGPHVGEDLSLHLKQAEELVTNKSIDPFDASWIGLGVLGGVLYRAGQYEQAAQRLEESIAAYPHDPLRTFRTPLDWRLVLAMTKWQQGQRDEARRLLAETKPALDEWLQSPSNFWLRRARIEVLRREAEALIGPKEADEVVENESRTAHH